MKTCPHCDFGYHDKHTTCPTHGVVLNEIRDLRPGMEIRRTYRIVRKIGNGGMGTVYQAHHMLMKEPRALKFLSGDFSSDETFISRFLREVQSLRQVHSKNVVGCGDLEPAEDDSLFFSMEYVDGPDLRDFMDRASKPFDVRLALEITRGIAEGLGAAHAAGIVHRDIKPENILIARNGDRWVPKIADFGIVATKENSRAHTRTGGTLLTMSYAAPEQWRGVRATDLDGRTDLYALSGVLFEMLTGQTVFNAESYEGWAEQHRNVAPSKPSELRPELANWRGLDALVLWALAKDRDKRPNDVKAFIQALDGVGQETDDQDIGDRAKTVIENGPGATVPITIEAPSAESDSHLFSQYSHKELVEPHRKWRLLVVLIVVILAAAGEIGYFVWPRSSDSTKQNAGSVYNEVPAPLNSPVQSAPATQTGTPSKTRAPNAQANRPTTTPNFSSQADTRSQPAASPVEIDNPATNTQTKPVEANGQQSPAIDLQKQADGLWKDKRYADAVPLYDKSCGAGDQSACVSLGWAYFYGNGIQQNDVHGMDLWSKACDAGFGFGCGSLVTVYKLTDASPSKVLPLAQKGCPLNDAESCFVLGLDYWNGKAVAQDQPKAKDLFQKACSLGVKAGCDPSSWSKYD